MPIDPRKTETEARDMNEGIFTVSRVLEGIAVDFPYNNYFFDFCA